MKLMWVPAVLLFILIAGQATVLVIQGNTIEQQRALIREMIHNPQCLIPAAKEKP